jgi:hypothetical protein
VLLGRIKVIPEGQKMALAMPLQDSSCLLKVGFCGHSPNSSPKTDILSKMQEFSS